VCAKAQPSPLYQPFVLSPEQLRDTDANLSLNGCLRILSEYIHVFPWHFFIRSSSRFARKSKNRNGMLVARLESDCFCTN
jgi:hypothetical protein